MIQNRITFLETISYKVDHDHNSSTEEDSTTRFQQWERHLVAICEKRNLSGSRMNIMRRFTTELLGLDTEDEHEDEDDSGVTFSNLVLVLLLVLGIRILGMVLVNQKVIPVFGFKNNSLTAEAFQPII